MLIVDKTLLQGLPYFFRAERDGQLFFLSAAHFLFLAVFVLTFIFLLRYMRGKNELTATDMKIEDLLNFLIFTVICLLYGWYWAAGYTKDHLPLYHCRLIMILLVLSALWRRAGKGKAQSVLEELMMSVATMGAWMAALVAMPDEFIFPHVTNYTYAVGHFALLGIVFYTIKRWTREPSWQDLGKQQLILLGYNVLLAIFDIKMGENYGYLFEAPIATDFFRQLPQVVYSSGVIVGYAILLFICWLVNRWIYRYLHRVQTDI